MSEHRLTSAPDYTNAALTMLGVNLMWIFFVIWVVFGLIPVLLLALGLNHGITRLAGRS
jgi:hypothetical protein